MANNCLNQSWRISSRTSLIITKWWKHFDKFQLPCWVRVKLVSPPVALRHHSLPCQSSFPPWHTLMWAHLETCLLLVFVTSKDVTILRSFWGVEIQDVSLFVLHFEVCPLKWLFFAKLMHLFSLQNAEDVDGWKSAWVRWPSAVLSRSWWTRSPGRPGLTEFGSVQCNWTPGNNQKMQYRLLYIYNYIIYICVIHMYNMLMTIIYIMEYDFFKASGILSTVISNSQWFKPRDQGGLVAKAVTSGWWGSTTSEDFQAQDLAWENIWKIERYQLYRIYRLLYVNDFFMYMSMVSIRVLITDHLHLIFGGFLNLINRLLSRQQQNGQAYAQVVAGLGQTHRAVTFVRATQVQWNFQQEHDCSWVYYVSLLQSKHDVTSNDV